jgi:alcohol dehydrogenase (NADP+)
MDVLTFLNGDTMPILGLGTWRAERGLVYEAVRNAIRIGYRHIDCASIYMNEQEVGTAITDAIGNGDVTRSELWITSKLWNDSHHPDSVKPALQRQLQDLGLEYLDLYLVHWPVAFKAGVRVPRTAEDLVSPEELPLSETWTAMEQCFAGGLCRHIGVSNCSERMLGELLKSCTHKPEMNQVEIHPFNPQSELVSYCHANQIHVTAYASLGSKGRPEGMIGDDEPDLLSHPVVRDIALRRGMTPAQVLLGWAMYKGIAVIPKSVRQDRLLQNFNSSSFTLKANDVAHLDNLEARIRFVTGDFWAFPGSAYTPQYLWD